MRISGQVLEQLATAVKAADSAAASARSRVVQATAAPQNYGAAVEGRTNAAEAAARIRALLAEHGPNLDLDIEELNDAERTAADTLKTAQEAVDQHWAGIRRLESESKAAETAFNEAGNRLKSARETARSTGQKLTQLEGAHDKACAGCDPTTTGAVEKAHAAARDSYLQLLVQLRRSERLERSRELDSFEQTVKDQEAAVVRQTAAVQGMEEKLESLQQTAKTSETEAASCRKESQKAAAETKTLVDQQASKRRALKAAEDAREAALTRNRAEEEASLRPVESQTRAENEHCRRLMNRRHDLDQALESYESAEPHWLEGLGLSDKPLEIARELREVERALEHHEQQVQQLNAQMSAIQRENAALRDSIVREHAPKVERLTQEADDLGRRLAERQRRAEEMQRMATEHTSAMEQARAEAAKTKTKLGPAKEELQKLQASLRKELQRQSTAAASLATAKKAEEEAERAFPNFPVGDPQPCPELQRKLEAAESALRARESELKARETADARCRQARDAVDEQRDRAAQAKKDCEDLEASLPKLKNVISERSKALDAARADHTAKAHHDRAEQEGERATRERKRFEQLKADLLRARDDAVVESVRPIITAGDPSLPDCARPEKPVAFSADHLKGETNAAGHIVGGHHKPSMVGWKIDGRLVTADSVVRARLAEDPSECRAVGARIAPPTGPQEKYSTLWPATWDQDDIKRAVQCSLQSPQAVTHDKLQGRCWVDGAAFRVETFRPEGGVYNTVYPRL